MNFSRICFSSLSLLLVGIWLTFASTSDSQKDMALVLAAKKGSVEEVYEALNSGGGVNSLVTVEGKYQLTPLIAACISGSPEVVKFLLSKNADPNLKDAQGNTALLITASIGNSALVEILLSHGADPKIRNNNGRTAAMKAAEYGRFNIISIFQKKGFNTGNLKGSSVIGAVRQGSISKLQELLQINATVNAVDENGLTPMMLASLHCQERIALLLLEEGADISYTDPGTGETALHIASRSGCIEIVKMLLKAGANTTVKNHLSETPLILAVSSESVESVRMLLSAGSNPNIKSEFGDTPLRLARSSGNKEIEEMLLKAGALE